MRFRHGLGHTENAPHAGRRRGETGECPLLSVSLDERLASALSTVAVATNLRSGPVTAC